MAKLSRIVAKLSQIMAKISISGLSKFFVLISCPWMTKLLTLSAQVFWIIYLVANYWVQTSIIQYKVGQNSGHLYARIL